MGLLSGDAGQSNDGVVEDGWGGRVGETAAGQGRALAFGDTGAAGVLGEQPESVLLAGAGADRVVAGVASVVERAVNALATEAGEIAHGASGPSGSRRETDKESTTTGTEVP